MGVDTSAGEMDQLPVRDPAHPFASHDLLTNNGAPWEAKKTIDSEFIAQVFSPSKDIAPSEHGRTGT